MQLQVVYPACGCAAPPVVLWVGGCLAGVHVLGMHGVVMHGVVMHGVMVCYNDNVQQQHPQTKAIHHAWAACDMHGDVWAQGM